MKHEPVLILAAVHDPLPIPARTLDLGGLA